MSGDRKGIPVGPPDRPHEPKDVYGGMWGHCEPLGEDTSGRGSAPRAPGPPAARVEREPLTFTRPEGEQDDGPEIAADDAGASARCETPQPKKPGKRHR